MRLNDIAEEIKWKRIVAEMSERANIWGPLHKLSLEEIRRQHKRTEIRHIVRLMPMLCQPAPLGASGAAHPILATSQSASHRLHPGGGAPGAGDLPGTGKGRRPSTPAKTPFSSREREF